MSCNKLKWKIIEKRNMCVCVQPKHFAMKLTHLKLTQYCKSTRFMDLLIKGASN